jgi:hypothetical protein
MEKRSKLVATLPNGKNLNRQGREVCQGGIVFCIFHFSHFSHLALLALLAVKFSI